MIALRRKMLFVLIDIMIINFSVFLAYFVLYQGEIPQEFYDNIIGIFTFATVSSLIVYYAFNLYGCLWKYVSIEDVIRISVAQVVALVLLILYYNLVQIQNISTGYIFILIYVFSVVFISVSRMGYRITATFKSAHSNTLLKEIKKRVMIIGAGDAGAMVIKELNSNPQLGMKPIAVIDDDKRKHHSKIMGVNVYGGREHIKDVARNKKIDEIIIAIPSSPKMSIKEILNQCKETKCKLKTLPGVYELIGEKVTIKQIRDVQIEDLLGRAPVNVDLKEISGYLQDEIVLVTGGGGSIGSELCRQISRFNPKKLLILDIYENNAYDLQQELIFKHPDLDLEVLIASVRDRDRLEEIFDLYKPGVVFHAAAHKHVPLMEHNPTEAIKNNVFGTLNLAECADKYKTKGFVLISTDKAVNPTNIMGATKRIAEMIIQSFNKHSQTKFVAVRFGNVLGSNGSVIPLFKRQIAKGGPVTVTHPEVNRFFMTILEAVQLVIQSGAMAKGGEIFVLDMGQPVKIIDLARDLIKLSGFEPNVDIKLEITALRPGEKLYEELLMNEEALAATKHEKIFIEKPIFSDINKLREELEKLKLVLFMSREGLINCIERMVPTYKRII